MRVSCTIKTIVSVVYYTIATDLFFFTQWYQISTGQHAYFENTSMFITYKEW